MDCELAYFLDLRQRLRGRSEALEIVDRCISIVARAAKADPDELRDLEAEIARLADDLALRFGAPANLRVH